MSSHRRKALRGLIWAAAERGGTQVIQVATVAVLARFLDASAFGLLAMAQVFTAIGQMAVEQGLAQAVVQRRELSSLHLDTAFWLQMAMGLVVMGLVMGFAQPIARLYGRMDLAPILVALSPIVVLHAMSSMQRALLQRDIRMKRLAVRSLVSQVTGGAVAVLGVLLGWGVWSLVFQVLAYRIVEVLVLWRTSSWRPGLCFSGRCCRELMEFSGSVLGLNAVIILGQRGLDFLIGFYMGSIALGYYTVALRLLRALQMLVTGVVQSVMFPLFSRVQEKPDQLARLFLTGTYWSSLLFFPVIGLLIVHARELVVLAFGARFEPAVPVFMVLAVNTLQSVFSSYNASVLRAAGKPQWLLWIGVAYLCGSIALFFPLHRYGLVAVAAGLVAVSSCLAPVGFMMLRRVLTFDRWSYLWPLLRIAGYTGAAVATAVALRWAVPPDLPGHGQVLLSAGLAGLVYGGLALACERTRLRQMISWVAVLRRDQGSVLDTRSGSGAV